MSHNELLEQIRASYEADRQRKAVEAREEAEYAEASKVLFDQAGSILRAYGELKNTEGWEGSVPGVYGSGRRVTLYYRETPIVTLPTEGESISLSISGKPHKFSDSSVYYIKGTGLDPADKKQSKKRLF
ncbi:MAG: hypothetical protein UZ21_OP11001000442 [Microgenomates bacterium OLB22]|nr:MAG: hypothetical protein UZ21_OP11001000442 [Microgenomates bacterium OLB22]